MLKQLTNRVLTLENAKNKDIKICIEVNENYLTPEQVRQKKYEAMLKGDDYIYVDLPEGL